MKYLQKLITKPISDAIQLDENNVPTEQIFLKLVNSNEVPYISKPSYIDVNYDFGDNWDWENNDGHNIFGESLWKDSLYAICIDGVFHNLNTINRKFNFSDGRQHTVRFYFKYNNYIEDIIDNNINNLDDTAGDYPRISFDFNNFNAQGLVNINDVFSNSGITDVYGNLGSWDVSNVTDMSHLFEYAGNVHNIKSINKWDVSNVTDMSYMFATKLNNAIENRTKLKLNNWDVHNVTDMSHMFAGCTYLTTVGNLSGWNVSNVEDMSAMFYGCSNLTSLDLSGWIASACTAMTDMFYNCHNLTTLDLSGLQAYDVTDVSGICSGCYNLTSANFTNFANVNITNMDEMFARCESLSALNLTRWDVSCVTKMDSMFADCHSLSALNLSDWSTTVNANFMFFNCSGLTNLNIDELKFTRVDYTFYGCTSLASIELAPGFDQTYHDDTYFDFSDCPWTKSSITTSLIENQQGQEINGTKIVLSDYSISQLNSEEIQSIKEIGFEIYTKGEGDNNYIKYTH
jgi:surface protein